MRRNLGRTGISVSNLCLGTMMFGPIGNSDVDDCVRVIHRAIDAGINFIDTADVYSAGVSEQIVGQALKGRREHVVLATKFFNPMGQDSNMRGGSRRWIVKAVEDSLRRLDTDYIDLYQMHRFDSATDIDETLFTLNELIRQGKVRVVGSSMFPADRIVEAQWCAKERGYQPFRCEQSNYNIFARDIERFVLPACQRYGMGMITWSPLDGGFLSGRYRTTGDLDSDNRISRFNRMFRGSFDPHEALFQRKLELVGELAALADEAGLPIAQIATAFAIAHPAVTSVIIGPRTMDHLEGLLPVAEMTLPADLLARIDALVPPGTSVNPIADMPSALDKASLGRG